MVTARKRNETVSASAPQLLRFLNRESGRAKYRIVASSTASGLSRGLLLATFNAAAVVATEGNVEMWLVFAFAAVLAVHLITKYDSSYQGTRLVRRMVLRSPCLCGTTGAPGRPLLDSQFSLIAGRSSPRPWLAPPGAARF